MIKEIEAEMTREYATSERLFKGSRILIPLMNDLTLLDQGDTALKREIRLLVSQWGLSVPPVTTEWLKKAYDIFIEGIQEVEWDGQSSTPKEEKLFLDYFREASKKKIYANIWIGNHQLDAFLPTVREQDSIGINYEIDGGIHKNPIKRKKDEHKERYMKSCFGIRTVRFSNDAVNNRNSIIEAELGRLKCLKVPTTRELKNLWKKIHIATLIEGSRNQKFMQAHPDFILGVLGMSKEQLQTLLDIFIPKKQSTRLVTAKNIRIDRWLKYLGNSTEISTEISTTRLSETL